MDRASIITRVKIKMDEFTPPGVRLPFDDYIGPVLDEAAKEIAEMVPLHFLTPVSMVVKTTKRSITDDVATLTTATIHPFRIGDYITVSGITEEVSYNGTFQVTVVGADYKTLSYALTHTDEAEDDETGGTIIPQITIEDYKAYFLTPSDYLRLYELKFPLWTKSVRDTVKVDSDAGRLQDNPYLRSGIGRPSVVITTTQLTGGSLGQYFVCGRVETLAIPKILYVAIPRPEDLNDKIIDQLSWLCTSKLFIITGYPDKAKAMFEQFGISMQLLIKV